ncbi:MAG: hypothetical protein ACOC85_05355 [Thermoplasmatota archaeon]
MPDNKFHVKVDEEILKPLGIIPENFTEKVGFPTRAIHEAMDKGTDDFGKNHRFMDKWHDPEYIARMGHHNKRNGNIPPDHEEQYMYCYRVAKFHLMVDELQTRSTKELSIDDFREKIKEIKNDKQKYETHFAHKRQIK